jgi:hypothetical protein
MDPEDLGTLANMIELGTQYIAEQDEPEDQPNIAPMKAILDQIAALVPVELAEPEPSDEPEDEGGE